MREEGGVRVLIFLKKGESVDSNTIVWQIKFVSKQNLQGANGMNICFVCI
jgi:hypothetical protein